MIGFILRIPKSDQSYRLNMDKALEYFKTLKTEREISYTSKVCDYRQIRRNSGWYDPYEEEFLRVWVLGGIILPKEESIIYDSYASTIVTWYKKGGMQLVTNQLNGPFTVIIEDLHLDTVFLVSDKIGYSPIFEFEDKDNWLIASNPDVLSVVQGHLDLDYTSMAEYLRYGRVEYPNTYYQQVKQLSPSTIIEFKEYQRKVTKYWYPEAKFSRKRLNKKILTEQLADALKSAVSDLTNSSFGRHGLFLSGGTDSRAILFSANNKDTLIASTFFDDPNAELETAQSLAKRVNVEHKSIQRSSEHYAMTAPEYTLISNGMGALHDNHYLSFREKLEDLGQISWHTGCFADWFFKGIAYNFSYLKIANKVIPTWKIFAQPRRSYYISESTLSEKYQELVDTRLACQFSYDNQLDPNSALDWWQIELIRLRPINRECDFGSRQTLKAYFNWIPLLSDNRLIELWQKIPPDQKLNGEIWGKAVAKICKGHNDIKDNNWGTLIGSSKYSKTFFFLLEVVKRKLRKKPVNSMATTGSWPNFRLYLKQSKLLPLFWKSRSNPNAKVIKEILGYDPLSWTPEEWSNKDVILFNRIFTLKIWLELYDHDFELDAIKWPTSLDIDEESD